MTARFGLTPIHLLCPYLNSTAGLTGVVVEETKGVVALWIGEEGGRGVVGGEGTQN